MSELQSQKPQIQVSRLLSLPTEIRLHIFSYIHTKTCIISDFHRLNPRRPFRIQSPPSPLIGALKSCKTLHNEIEELLYTKTTFNLRFGYNAKYCPRDGFRCRSREQCRSLFSFTEDDRPDLLRANIFARFLYQVGLRQAGVLTRLELVFEHGHYEETHVPIYHRIYDSLATTIELLQLYTPGLKELVIVVEIEPCMFSHEVADAKAVLFDVGFALEKLQVGGALRALERFMVEGLPKTEEWEVIQRLERGVVRGVVRGEDGEAVEGTWGKELADWYMYVDW